MNGGGAGNAVPPFFCAGPPLILPTVGAVGPVLLPEEGGDPGEDAFGILHDVGIGDADHATALASHRRGAGCVRECRHCMGVAVDFDHRSFRKTEDVGVTGAERCLMAPFQVREGLAEGAEQAASGRRRVAAALPGAWRGSHRLMCVKAHLSSPFRRCAAPSLSRGRGNCLPSPLSLRTREGPARHSRAGG